jgi:hypothetical protein
MFVDPTGETTYSVGGTAAAAFLLQLGLSGNLVIDDKGNVGIIPGLTIGGGTPSASAGGIITVTTANTIFDLNGIGFSAGGSAAFGLPVYIGGDTIVGTAKDGTPVYGVAISVGGGTPWPEGHANISISGVISLNWLPIWMKNSIIDMVKKVAQ